MGSTLSGAWALKAGSGRRPEITPVVIQVPAWSTFLAMVTGRSRVEKDNQLGQPGNGRFTKKRISTLTRGCRPSVSGIATAVCRVGRNTSPPLG